MTDETKELTIQEQQEQETHRDVDETMRDSQWHIYKTEHQSIRVEDEEEEEWENHDQVDLIIYATELNPDFLSENGRTVMRWEYSCRFELDTIEGYGEFNPMESLNIFRESFPPDVSEWIIRLFHRGVEDFSSETTGLPAILTAEGISANEIKDDLMREFFLKPL